MVRIKDGNYIAIFHDRMIEVKADSKKDAYKERIKLHENHYFLQCASENRIHFSHEADRNALYRCSPFLYGCHSGGVEHVCRLEHQ